MHVQHLACQGPWDLFYTGYIITIRSYLMAKIEGRGVQVTELFTVVVQVFPTWSKKCKITSGKSGSQDLSWEVAFCSLYSNRAAC